MVSHLFYYQLALIALGWLCVMLQWAWPSDPAPCPPAPEPTPQGQSAIVSPHPLRGLPPSHPAMPVSTAPPPARKRPQLPHPVSCPHGGGGV